MDKLTLSLVIPGIFAHTENVTGLAWQQYRTSNFPGHIDSNVLDFLSDI